MSDAVLFSGAPHPKVRTADSFSHLQAPSCAFRTPGWSVHPHGLQAGGEADEHLAVPRWQLLVACSMPSVNLDLSGSWLSCTLKRKGVCRKDC